MKKILIKIFLFFIILILGTKVYANNLNVKYVVIIGEDEIKNNEISLKNMITGEQTLVTLEDAINIIKK